MDNLSKTFGKLTIPLLVLLTINFSAIPARAKYGGGTGEPNDPYLIFTAEQMNEIGLSVNWDDWDKHFKLMADINLSAYTGTNFNIIGNTTTAFTGVFDGNGHTISNFTYTSTFTDNVGLFGYVTGPNGEIKNLGLIDPNVDGGTRYYVGSLVGWLGGTVTDCYVQGGSVSGYRYNCRYVGGLGGVNYGTISNCYATASVSGYEYVGGLVGRNGKGRLFVQSTISNCYSTGTVSGYSAVGGLVGDNRWGKVTVSFWDIQTSGQTTSAGGMGKTTAEMQTASTFIGWGCNAVWTIDDGNDYPRLVWENKPGQLITAQLSDFVAGNGTQTNPYLIYTAEELNLIGLFVCDWDKHFKLMADIDLTGFTGTNFNIMGYCVASGHRDNRPFTGVFDGNDHTIANFTYTSTYTHSVGIFGYVTDPNAEIKNLGLINPDVDAGTGRYAGSLVGWLREGTITNCYSEGGSFSGDEYVGGLVGVNYYGGTITNCYSTAFVSGNDRVGGLVGYNYSATISNCYSSGDVAGDSSVGGLVGYNGGTIANCYVKDGTVAGSSSVGGLVGSNWDTITNSYSTGSVTGDQYVGGLAGKSTRVVHGAYWNTETSGQSTSAGGMGKTTAEMQKASTFIGWGCNAVWTIDDGNDYPRLVWENKPGQLITAQLSDFVAGNGTQTNPYLIYTAEELNLIGLFVCDWDKHFKLMADIDLSGFTGTSFNIIGAFSGTFDGNGHTISNFTYTSTYTSRIGLFGYVRGENAQIKDLGLIDPDVEAGTGYFGYYYYAGSLVAILSDGTISNCYVEGGNVSGHYDVGGLVGGNWGTITNCYSTGSVAGSGHVGGLVGANWEGTIANSYSTADVSGDSSVGGLVGHNAYRGSITNCYSEGDVLGDEYVGGLVGQNWVGTISNCYSTSSVSGNDKVGGLVGYSNSGTITNCYSTAFVSGTTDVGGLVGYNYYGSYTKCLWDNTVNSGLPGIGNATDPNVIGESTANMQTESTFTNAGWDFVNIWDLTCEGMNYPRFIWQIPSADFVCPHGVDFRDYSFFANHWMDSNCGSDNDCDGADLDFSDKVDSADLKIFCDNWLAGVE